MTKGHGGEDAQVVPSVCLSQKNNLSKNKFNSELTSKKEKFNTIDKIINKNTCSTNDIRINELKVTTNMEEMKEPTPVTYFKVLKIVIIDRRSSTTDWPFCLIVAVAIA